MKEDLFQELVASVREGGAILRGETEPSRTFTIEVPDVKAVRTRMRLTQQEFALLLGISVRTLQNWEQGRRTPHGPARVLLQVAEKHPEALLDTIMPAEAASATRYTPRVQSVSLHDRDEDATVAK